MADNPSHTAVISRHVVLSRRAPTAEDLWQLQQAGIRTVLDLRLPSEFDTGLAPEEEADAVRAHGMEYRAWPVPEDISDREVLDRFGEIIAQAAKPVLVHDVDGKRAGLLSVVHAAIETGVPGEEMLHMARSLDVLFGTKGQKQRLVAYVDLHEVHADPTERRKLALRAKAAPVPLLPEAYQRMAKDFKQDHSRRIKEDRDIVRADLAAHPPNNPVISPLPPPRSDDGETPISVYHPASGRAVRSKAATRTRSQEGHQTPSLGIADWLLSRRHQRPTRPPPLITAALAVSGATAAVWLLRRHPVPVLFALGFAAQRGIVMANRELRRRRHLSSPVQASQQEDEVSRLERDLNRLAAA